MWRLARRQHGVVTRAQLIARGYGRHAIGHRIATGRLHPVARGVYAVGRAQLTQHGLWSVAVLSCGEDAVLSHGSAAALLGIGEEESGAIEVSVRRASPRRPAGLVVHRRPSLWRRGPDRRRVTVGWCERLPTTSPTQTILDMATRLPRAEVERMINEADIRGLIGPEELRAELEAYSGQPGVRFLRTILDRRTFRFTRSELERWFLPLARDAGMPPPLTAEWVNGFEVDFHWPDLRFLVETDGLRYHRTPAEQARDRVRDQTHTAAGYSFLRFTHEQIRYERDYVRGVLAATFRRLSGRSGAAAVPSRAA